MEKIMSKPEKIEVSLRAGVGKGAARQARREGLVPGVIYGGNQEPVAINVKFSDLLKRLKAGHFLSTLQTVVLDGKEETVICRGVQRDTVKDLPTHIDFLRLSEKSRISLNIPVVFENEDAAPGIRKGGTLVVVRDQVELRVTAGNIPDHVTVDMTGLEVGDVVHIQDIDLPKGTRPTVERNFVIANISAPSALSSAENEAAGEEGEAAAEGASEE